MAIINTRHSLIFISVLIIVPLGLYSKAYPKLTLTIRVNGLLNIDFCWTGICSVIKIFRSGVRGNHNYESDSPTYQGKVLTA